ncbi:WD40 repeat domain-containing protein [Phytohabitans sp. LJ34]|uniref:WD40 repeat domain-containing protein n=1 Tax=Phytohabitans sp. LJ34 TaxID=3452217 RepID=UPI003F8A06FB
MFGRRSFTAAVVAAALLLVSTPAAAAAPTAVWSAPGLSSASFSVDGALVVLTGNTSAGGRLEIRGAGSGALVRALSSPYKFNAAALSADKQTVAVTLNDTSSGLPVRTIRLYRVSDGALLRAVPTAATRDLSSLDLSADGRLVAAMDARSYEQGGRVHVHRVADGGRVALLTTDATTAAVRFSPDGRFLAANGRRVVGGRFVSVVRVFRTADWAAVTTAGDGSLLVRWSPDSTAIWTATLVVAAPTTAHLVAVPGGTALRTVTLAPYDTVSDVTDDGARMLTGRVVAPRRTLTFSDTSTGTPAATYDFASDVFAGDISPDGTLFTYALTTAPSAFDVHVARMPGR